jgi:hypothetical protein
MKVECIKLNDPIVDTGVKSDGWLTVGQIYTVLEILVRPGHYILFRLISDDANTPALFDSRQFEIVSNKIPSNWVAVLHEQELHITPEKWLIPGFWEDYFDGVAEATKNFEEEKRLIIKEAG